uniref:Embryo surrounding factor 1 brassicaceae domain-containing protein n=1 Tax=Arundo donax TaxID=35708 RepID=A0A0A8XWD0_ARUDO
MAPRHATLKALLVATLVTSLLLQGTLGDFHCCFCNCYNDCKRGKTHPKDRERCHWECFKKPDCKFSCQDVGHCKAPYDDLVRPAGMGVALGAGGGSQAEANGTETGAAP